MGNETKWADVAHYYTKSQIDLQIKNRDHAERFLMVSFRNVGGSHFEEWVNDGVYWRAYGSQFSAWADHKPILRHRDDMTESECIDYTEFVWADSEFSKVNRSQKISVVWAKDSVNLREMYRKCLFAVRQKGIMWPFFPKDINQLGFHWLVSRGFDVFGLIESGQAIRKEMGNGNS